MEVTVEEPMASASLPVSYTIGSPPLIMTLFSVITETSHVVLTEGAALLVIVIVAVPIDLPSTRPVTETEATSVLDDS